MIVIERDRVMVSHQAHNLKTLVRIGLPQHGKTYIDIYVFFYIDITSMNQFSAHIQGG